jgi:plasmid stabilization system protein ParE
MTPRLSLRREAQEDIRKAAGWYEERRVGLGTEFTRAVGAQLAAIEREPELFPVARAEVRRALVRRFPYAVYFVAEPEATVVLACLHVRRDPETWQSRAGI